MHARTTACAAAAALLFLSSAWAQSSIGEIQGSGHLSSFAGRSVANISGIVTAVDNNGFWIQDSGDNNARTSDAIYVFRGSTGTKATVGDLVRVAGQVQEFRAGNDANSLTSTQINATASFSGDWTRVSANNALPTAFLIGGPGALVPNAIAPKLGGSVEAGSYQLNPQQYAMDYYEALEGMRVSLGPSTAVGPTPTTGNYARDTFVVSNSQLSTGLMSSRGAVVIADEQFNGHRIALDNRLLGNAAPVVNTGAQIGAVTGVMDYSWNNYRFIVTSGTPAVSGNTLEREVAAARAAGQFGIASYNVENLGGNAAPARFTAIVNQIKNNLGTPEIIALQEVQDNNGATNNGVVAADVTLQNLVNEIKVQTGKDYAYVTVNPAPGNTDGGQPGGNIRQAFLYEVGKAGIGNLVGGSGQAMSFSAGANGRIDFNFSAGRIDPGNSAFANSRKPLVADFEVNGQQLILISNHFNSKGGDQPLFGPNQAPVNDSEVQRLAQAETVAAFVKGILAINPRANIIVMGDLNDFQFADTLNPLSEAGLINMTNTLAANERYTYNFQGNAQALDHMFVSTNLLGAASYDVLHINSEFSDQISDHDPTLLTLNLAAVPEPQTVALMLAGLGLIALRRRKAA